jgi:MarR family transcriptional regulator, organic hydroperoxide resistance regulator
MADQIIFEETVSYLLAKVTTAYRTALEKHMGSIGLHGGQTFVLLELWAEDGLRQVDLARRLSVSAPTINKMLKGLIEINLVLSRRVSGDARSTRVFLTKKGRDIRVDVERRWIDLEAECLTGLSETERLVLLEVLRKLRMTYTGRKDAEDE